MLHLPSKRLLLLSVTCLVGVATLATLESDVRAADETGAAEGTAEVAGPPSASPPSEPPTWDFELGGVVGYTSPPIRGGTSPFGVGLGGRAGFVFAGGVYVGIGIIDYLGAQDVDVKDTSLLYGLDIGYGIRLATIGNGSLTLRPQVGGGGVTVIRTDPSTATTTTTPARPGRRSTDVVSGASGGSGSSGNVTTVDSFYVEPGVSLIYAAGAFFAGLNGNVLVIPGITYSGAAPATWVSYGTQAQAGLRF